MLRSIVGAFLLIVVMAAPASLLAQPVQSGYVQVNGTRLYYEVHGAGPPLVMLHGGVTPSEMFGTPLAEMAKNFKVIAIHARGHGLSKDTPAPWSIEQDADDVAAVLKHLKIDKASVMGSSFGGAAGPQVAHPAPAKP